MSSPDDVSPSRFVAPGAEQWIGRKIPCLDHGFIYLVDAMGGDPSIVQAARVSYGLGTKSVHEDRGLIRYLMRHDHTTPFEMVELKFHVKLPIFVARQWIRHRTACLSGETTLFFDLPGARKRARRQRHGMTIEKFHRLWHHGTRHPIEKKKPLFLERVDVGREYTVPELARLVARREKTLRGYIRSGALEAERRGASSPTSPSLFVSGEAWHRFALRRHVARVPMRDRLARMRLRMCDESSGEILATTVTDVWESGVKPVYRVTLENGYSIKMTKDHRCLTERGWMTLDEAAAPHRNSDGGVSWNGNGPALAVNGVPSYRDEAWLSARRDEGLDVDAIAQRAGTSYHTIRKYLKAFGLQYSSVERSRLSGLAQRGQRRTLAKPRTYTPDWLQHIREARSGERSNFWRGGVTTERANIARWTKEQAARVHARYGHRCAICRGTEALHAHHADPVWNNAARARDTSNLISLCRPCHQTLHGNNLELELLQAVQVGTSLSEFWTGRSAVPRPRNKRSPTVRRLVRSFARIARIEFAGYEMTYDLAVSGPFHNFVANGFIVHNSVNEYSGRYSVMPDEFYLPTSEQVTQQSAGNRQGGDERVPPERAGEVLDLLREEQRTVREGYDRLLGWDIRRELARINLGVAQYTEWYWKNDLHNIFHFLRLRLDEHAQHEIRVYAEAMATIVRAVVPVAWEAFEDYQLRTVRFTRLELESLARLLADARPDDERLLAALPEAWRERDARGALKRNREREEFLAKLRGLLGG